jgi:hypothetical protein
MNTQFTVRSPGTSPWDVTTFPVVNGCQKQYPGYDGSIYWLLDQVRSSDAGGGPNPKYNKDSTGTVGPAGQTMVDGFRRWVTLCTIDNPPVGDYLVQVKTNGLTTTKAGVTTSMDAANASNHFAIRAYNPTVGAPAVDKENLAIAGREKMGIYANKPGVTTEFHLARVPSTAKGQTLKVRLFDVGDSAAGGSTGTINVVRPPDATGDAFGLAASPCVGTLSTNASVNLTSCSLTGVQSSTHNGKWQSINVPIPANYACTDSDSTKCWVRLQYVYGSSTSPNDVTAWTATIEGDPVRLVE